MSHAAPSADETGRYPAHRSVWNGPLPTRTRSAVGSSVLGRIVSGPRGRLEACKLGCVRNDATRSRHVSARSLIRPPTPALGDRLQLVSLLAGLVPG